MKNMGANFLQDIHYGSQTLYKKSPDYIHKHKLCPDCRLTYVTCGSATLAKLQGNKKGRENTGRHIEYESSS